MIRTLLGGTAAGLAALLALLAGAAALAVLAGCRGTTAAAAVQHTGAAGEDGTRLIQVDGSPGIAMDADSVKLAGITTTVVGMSDVSRSLAPTGEITPTESGTVQVTSRLPGRIVRVDVSAGARVHKGQVLALVDSVDLAQAEAAYQTAVAHMRLMADQLQQQRRLAQYGALSEPAVEDARRTYAAAQAAVASDAAQVQVDKLTLANTRKLVDMGEITRKPVEDAQNASAQAQAAAAQAHVALRSAKTDLDRAGILYNGGVYSRQQLEDAEAAYSNAQAGAGQADTQQKLAADELARQRRIYAQNLNGSSSLQAAQSKVQQDEHTYQNDLTAAGLARVALKRAEVVRKSGIPVSQALQQAQDAYDEAKVGVQSAANTVRLYGVAPGAGVQQLDDGHAVVPITAPLDGIVDSRNATVGQMTDTSTPLFKLLNLDRVYVDAQVYEQDLGDVAVGSLVRLRVPAYPNRVFRGRVSYISHEVSEDTRTATVRTVVPNPGWLLRAGMFASVEISGRGGRRALAVPEDAVIQEAAGQSVYVQTGENEFVRRAVHLAPAVQGRARVISGLSEGDRVVVAGNLFLDSEQKKLQSEKRGGD